jgi:protein phosphatase
MGGAMAGEFASKITVEKVTKILPPLFRQNASGPASGYGAVMLELFTEIHRSLVYLGSCYDECRGMGATPSLCWFTPGWMYFAHVGDSRIYFLPAGGGMKQITNDDTYVGWLFRNGQINEREEKNHPQRNVLQKVLGANPQQIEPQVGAVGLEPGDRFLVCTDGVTDGLFDSRIEDILRNTPREAAPALVREAIAASGRDTATAVVVDIVG